VSDDQDEAKVQVDTSSLAEAQSAAQAQSNDAVAAWLGIEAPKQDS
jgi:hypothetical protein